MQASNSFTYPECSPAELRKQLTRLQDAYECGDDLAALVDFSNSHFRYPPLDGKRVYPSDLENLRNIVMERVQALHQASIDNIDYEISTVLYNHMNILRSQTGSHLMWETLSAFILPEFIAFRFGSQSKLPADRIKGGRRNALSRLWFRRFCISTEQEQKYGAIISQDLVQQIVERPRLASDPRQVSYLLDIIAQHSHAMQGEIRSFYRELIKEATLLSAVSYPQLMTDDQLYSELAKRALFVAQTVEPK